MDLSGERIVKNAKLQYFIYVYTIINVNITFDPAKNEVNIAKHEVSLALAAKFENERRIIGLRKANRREVERYAQT